MTGDDGPGQQHDLDEAGGVLHASVVGHLGEEAGGEERAKAEVVAGHGGHDGGRSGWIKKDMFTIFRKCKNACGFSSLIDFSVIDLFCCLYSFQSHHALLFFPVAEYQNSQ